ncbi:hypothetical protein [Haloarcula amylovorans]|uniref:hypothetical protein n=1 Tax=Haloarcula amylovorans TaxID=2562280 RepID=UPI0014308A75|nr:hypothetical protein [Halomicroarcula amylolytica]
METSGELKFTSIEFPDSSHFQREFELAPGETNESEIENLPTNFAIVIAVHHGTEIIAVASTTCEGNLNYFEVRSDTDGASIAHNCEGRGWF